MTDAVIHQLYPAGVTAADLTDDDLLALYSPEAPLVSEAGSIRTGSRPYVRANFISSVDGSATAAGLSGELGAPADKRVFDLLRQLSDVILVGAGTVRDEGYGAMVLGADAARWRVAHGRAEQPALAIVTGSLNLDPTSDVFTKAPVRPIVLTAENAAPERRAALQQVADVVDCGAQTVEPQRMVDALAERGLGRIHCEGGPTLFGALVQADLIDSLCLTVSPSLEGGAGPRISRTHTALELRAMTLDHVLLSGSMMLTQYSRDRG